MTRSAPGRSLGLVLLGAVAACAAAGAHGPARSGQVEAGCPRSAPRECAGKAPSYADDVLPILERRCFACHAGDGPAAEDHDFSSVATLRAQRRGVADQISACAMPPASKDALRAEEASGILMWVACGGEAK